jgi:hypothetical protein
LADVTLQDLAEQIYALGNPEATVLMRRVLQDLSQGVTPSRKSINILIKLLEEDTPCSRLTDDGLCNGWLRKNTDQFNFPIVQPYQCPFVEQQNKKAKFGDCPGYRRS